MHLATASTASAAAAAVIVVVCTVNSRLLLKIAHFLSMRLWIFLPVFFLSTAYVVRLAISGVENMTRI